MLFAAYFIYLLFFSQNTLISQSRLYMQLRDLEKEESYYKKEIATIKKEQRELFSGINQMEKFARENYWMKRDSEDLYIFIESEK